MHKVYRVDLEDDGRPVGRVYFYDAEAATVYADSVNSVKLAWFTAQEPVETEISTDSLWKVC